MTLKTHFNVCFMASLFRNTWYIFLPYQFHYSSPINKTYQVQTNEQKKCSTCFTERQLINDALSLARTTRKRKIGDDSDFDYENKLVT